MAENKKAYLENDFVQEFIKEYKAVKGDKKAEELLDRTVGNNGYTLSQRFTLTGKIERKKNTIDDATQVYIVLPTNEGTDISLMSLMGVSSLKGYDLENVCEVEFGTAQKKQVRTVKSELVEDFDFADVWQPASRNLLELAGMIASGDLDLTNRTVTYLGTAVKPIVSKKKGEQNGEKFEVGFKRAIETKLWSVE
jgi:hypothetical protein